MTSIVVKDDKRIPEANSKKDGEYYDTCPTDGCLEVERVHKSGGRDGKGEEYLDWSIYNADPKKGGCGQSWSRTTPQGAERDKNKYQPKWMTKAGQTGRYTLLPSKTYQENYEKIFGHS